MLAEGIKAHVVTPNSVPCELDKRMGATDVDFLCVGPSSRLRRDTARRVTASRVCRMSDLAAPFLAVFPAGEDALAFWAFEALMQRAARNFRSDEQGIQCASLNVPLSTLRIPNALHVCRCVRLLMLAH